MVFWPSFQGSCVQIAQAYATVLLVLVLAGCQSPAPKETETIQAESEQAVATNETVGEEHDLGLSRALIERFPAIEDSEQLVIVETANYESTTGTLSTWAKEDGVWINHWEAIPINIGKTGFAEPDEKREGDGKSPSGIYPLGPAFGYEADLDTELEFIALDDQHYWMSAPDSATYNQLLHYQPATKEAEIMRRSDELYRYGLVVQYNMAPVVPGHGSAIFLHVQRGPGKPTLGCVSMEQQRMADLIEWLRPASDPLILMGPSSLLN